VQPVTNLDFALFAGATGYNASGAGLDDSNYLAHWIAYANGTVSFNETNDDGPRPVVWIAAADAQAYCQWRGKRLPTEWELQFAGQALPAGGSSYAAFPWGNVSCEAAPRAARPCAALDNSTQPRSPDAAGANAAGAAPAGVLDLSGLVWHLTGDAYCDALTCSTVLKGGSFFRPQAAMPPDAPELGPLPPGVATLYAPQALELGQHLKLPFASEAGQRGALTGFRCAADSAQSRRAGATTTVAGLAGHRQ